MELYIVPIMLFSSSVLMAFAWLAHIKFQHKKFTIALLASWFLVLPEYLLNISAIRWGHGTFEPSEMAAFNLCSGILCVALVSRFFLKESQSLRQIGGFALMAIGVVLVVA